MWYLWILTKAIKMLCLFLPTTKDYVEFIGREKARGYLQCICCKVKQWIQRELSHTIKSRCAYVDIWWIYMVANPNSTFLLKTYLSFEIWTYLLENKGYLIHLFFQASIYVPIVLNISNTCPFFLNSFFLLFSFLNNFCIAIDSH
jgi:hypothetical protein